MSSQKYSCEEVLTITVSGLMGTVTVSHVDGMEGMNADIGGDFVAEKIEAFKVSIHPAGQQPQRRANSLVVRGDVSVMAVGSGSIAALSIDGPVTIGGGRVVVGEPTPQPPRRMVEGSISITCGPDCRVRLLGCLGDYTGPNGQSGRMSPEDNVRID